MSNETFHSAGPLLTDLIAAQRLEAELVSYPRIDAVADGLTTRAVQIGSCLIWPIGPAAERVAGVAMSRSRGSVDVGAWNTDVSGRKVLLFSVAAVSPLALDSAADQLLRRGAAEVHACGVRVASAAGGAKLASYVSLDERETSSSLVLVGDAA